MKHAEIGMFATLVVLNIMTNLPPRFVGMRVAVGFTQSSPVTPIFEPVAFFLHRDPRSSSPSWVVVEWENPNNLDSSVSSGSFSVTPDHLVFVCANATADIVSFNHDCHPVAAKRISTGDLIINSAMKADGTMDASIGHVISAKTISKSETQLSGLFAPATSSGTLLVDGVLVSQFSTLPALSASFDNIMHSAAKKVVSPLITVSRRFKIATVILETSLNFLRSIVNDIIAVTWVSKDSTFQYCKNKYHLGFQAFREPY